MTKAQAQALLDALPGERREITATEHKHRLTREVVGGSASWRGIAHWKTTLGDALGDALRAVVEATYQQHGVPLPEAR